jgi:hypothetical protein
MRYFLLLLSLWILSGCFGSFRPPVPELPKIPKIPGSATTPTLTSAGTIDQTPANRQIDDLLRQIREVSAARDVAVQNSTDARNLVESLSRDQNKLYAAAQGLDVEIKQAKKREQDLRKAETIAWLQMWGWIAFGAATVGTILFTVLIFVTPALAMLWKKLAIGFGVAAALALAAIWLAPYYIWIGASVVGIIVIIAVFYILKELNEHSWGFSEVWKQTEEDILKDPRLKKMIARIDPSVNKK